MKNKVGIIMGSDSDLPVMKEAAEILDDFDIDYELTVVSAHRTPERLYNYGEKAEDEGFDLIIAGAGGAAHLPGMVAAITPLPVIGVPVKTSKLSGLDSLYSIVQMPGGVPVATVAINGAKNAALLAVEMLSIANVDLRNKYIEYKDNMEKEVQKTAARVEKMGYKDYLEKENN